MSHFGNVARSSDDRELLGETLTAKVWVLHGIAARCRSVTLIPGRQAEGFADVPVHLADLQYKMEVDGPSTD